MKKLILSTLFFSSLTFANSFQERADEVYLKTDYNYDIDCHYSFNKNFKLITPSGETIRNETSLQRSFIIDNNQTTIAMDFKLFKENGKYVYDVTFDHRFKTTGKLGKRSFYIPAVRDNNFNAQFETQNIVCNVNFAYENPYTLTDGNYNITVHPHLQYDWQKLLTKDLENYFLDPSYKSIILLETGNYRGNLVNIDTFLEGKNYTLPQNKYTSDLVNVPLDIPLLVSPAGHNRYLISAENELNVTFTGGNQNYCIWNNTREVLEPFMRSRSSAKVNIHYDAKNSVAQRWGIEGTKLNFPQKLINKSNRVSDLLRADEKAAIKYHAVYYSYFKTYFFKEFIGQFKTVTLTYDGGVYKQKDILHGNGERVLEVNLKYINL